MEPQAHNGHEHAMQTNESGATPGSSEATHEPGQPLPSGHPGLAGVEVGQSPHPQVVVPSQPTSDTASVSVVSTQPGLGGPGDQVNPSAVVQVLSPLGVEYVFMTISLFTAASGLAAALIALVNGKMDFEVLAFPTALLLVSVPIFAFLFLRAKKRELLYPTLRQDPSKRRSTQFTQIVCFIISMFTLVGLVSSVFAKMGGTSSISIVKVALDCVVLLVVFGGILAYYWRDEHRGR